MGRCMEAVLTTSMMSGLDFWGVCHNARIVQRFLIQFLAFALAGFAADVEPLSVSLLPNLPSPQPVGTIISLVPRLKNSANKVTYVAQYSVSVDGGDFHMIRDFSQDMPLIWSPELYEHEARVRVTVRNNDT